MIGEVVVCILHMMIFDILSGFTHSITVWIDFIAYATMNWCQMIVLIIIGCLDMGMLIYQWTSSEAYQEKINSHWLSRMGFWLIIAFYVVKIVASCWTYAVWRRDFRRIQGHVECCRPIVPARFIGGGAYSAEEPMNSDPERGMRSNNMPLPFSGQGVAIGGGGQPARGWNQNPDLYAQPQERQMAPAQGWGNAGGGGG